MSDSMNNSHNRLKSLFGSKTSQTAIYTKIAKMNNLLCICEWGCNLHCPWDWHFNHSANKPMYKIQDIVIELTLQLRLNISNILQSNLCMRERERESLWERKDRLFSTSHASDTESYLLMSSHRSSAPLHS